jgi:hypothetical protein
MDKAKRARTVETPKQPSLGLKLRAPCLYPDRKIQAGNLQKLGLLGILAVPHDGAKNHGLQLCPAVAFEKRMVA